MLVPSSASVVRDVLHAILSNLGLPKETVHTGDLLFHGSPLLLDEQVAVIRDGDTLEVKLREPVSKASTDASASKPRLNLNPGKKPMMKRSAVKRAATKPLFKFSPKPRPEGSSQTPIALQKTPKSTVAGSAGKKPRASIPLSKAVPPPARAPKTGPVPVVERRLTFAAPSGKTPNTAWRENSQQGKNPRQAKPPLTDSPPPQPAKIGAQDSGPLASEATPAVIVSVPDARYVKDAASSKSSQKPSTKKRPRAPPLKASPIKQVHAPTRKVHPAPIVRTPREVARKMDEAPVYKTATSELEKGLTATQHCKTPVADDNASPDSMLRGAPRGSEKPEFKIARMKGGKDGDITPTSRVAGVSSTEKPSQKVAAGKGPAEQNVVAVIIHPVEPRQSDELSAEKYAYAGEEQLRFVPGKAPSMAGEKPHVAAQPSLRALRTRIASPHEVTAPMEPCSQFAPSSGDTVVRHEPDKTAKPVSSIKSATSQRMREVAPAEQDLRFVPASDDATLEVPHAAAKPPLNAEQVAEAVTALVPTLAKPHMALASSSDGLIIEREYLSAVQTPICGILPFRLSNEKMESTVGEVVQFVSSAVEPISDEIIPIDCKPSPILGLSGHRPVTEPSLSVQNLPATLDKRVRFALPRVSISPHEEAPSSADPLPSSPPMDHSSTDSEEGAFASPFALTSDPTELASNNMTTTAKEQVAGLLHPDGFSVQKNNVMEQVTLKFVPSSCEPEGADTCQSEKSLSHILSFSRQPVASTSTLAVNTPVLSVQTANNPFRRRSINEAEEPKRTVSAAVERRMLKSSFAAKTDQVDPLSDVQPVRNDGGATRASTKLQSASPNGKCTAADATRSAETPGDDTKHLGESQLKKSAVLTLETGKQSSVPEEEPKDKPSHRHASPGVPLEVANVAFKAREKRKRCLSAEAKRKRNARNRRYAKRKRQEARQRILANNVINESISHTSASNQDFPTSPACALSKPPSDGHNNDRNSPGHTGDKNDIRCEKEALPYRNNANTNVQDVVKVAGAKQDLHAMKMKAITELEEGQCNAMDGLQQDEVFPGDKKLLTTLLPEVQPKTTWLNPRTNEGKAYKNMPRIMQGSVAAALRMARSHGVLESCKREPRGPIEARATSVSKEIPKPCTEKVSKAAANTSYPDTSSAPEYSPAKKRKISKRARAFIDEEQYNESFFVGFENSGGIPLPSPDLLDLFESPANSIRDQELSLPKGIVHKEDAVKNLGENHVMEEVTNSLSPFRDERKEVCVQPENKVMASHSRNHILKASASMQTGLSSKVSSKRRRTPEVGNTKVEIKAAPNSVSVAVNNEDVGKAVVSNGGWNYAKEDTRISTERRQLLEKDTSGKTASASTTPHSIVAEGMTSSHATVAELKAGAPEQKEVSSTNRYLQRKCSPSIIPPNAESHNGSRVAFQESKHVRLSGASQLIQRPPLAPAKPKVREWQSEYLTTPAGKVLNTSPFSDRNEPGQSATRDDLIFSRGSDCKKVLRSKPQVTQDQARDQFPDSKGSSSMPDWDSKHVAGERQSAQQPRVTGKRPCFSTRHDTSRTVDPKDLNYHSLTDLGSATNIKPLSGRRTSSSSFGVRSSQPRAQEKRVGHFPPPGRSTEDSYRANLMQTLTETTNAMGRFCKDRYLN